MMGVTHKATGVCAGAYVAWGVRALVVPEPAPPLVVVAVCGAALLLTLLAGQASLWPDLDHHNSTSTNSLGVVSGLIHEAVEAASIACWELTTTPADRTAGDFRNHRGLTHFAVTAVVFGLALGVGTWQLTARWPAVALGVAVGIVVGRVTPRVLALARWFGFFRKAGRRGRREALGWLAGALAAGLATVRVPETAAVDLALVGPVLGVGVGLAVTAGMLAHDLGDCATLAGVPFLWPLRISGQRYRAVHVRRRANLTRTTADSMTEWRLRLVSRLALAVAVVGWVPGLWETVWLRIPWPWAS